MHFVPYQLAETLAGMSEQSWAAVKRVVMAGGVLKSDRAYSDIADMSFIDAV